ncbi:MAG TPA: HAD hydrolase-like protein [Candidatus Limnocylindria bacterium]|nr:HAD hydrolase-like protein [Candidatus Limnocylindria bacterium]
MGRPDRASNIIFDLDGTLADSIPVLLELVNELKIVDRPLTRDDYDRAKNLSIQAILKELGIPFWRAPGLLIKGRAALTQRINEVPFFAGMDKVVRQLSKDHQLFVMSSNSLANVEKFLELHAMREPFKAVYGGVGIFGKAKVLRQIAKEHSLDKATTYYVGDEIRDVEAAKKAGLKSIAVTWGFNGDEILKAHQPDYLVYSPAELQQIFRED